MKKDNIKTALNIVSPVASAGSLLLPPLIVVPIIASVYNEVCSYWDSKSINKRIQNLQNEVEKQGISCEDFAERISEFEEHEQYVLRNNIKYLCLSAQPETTDALNKAIIDCVMSEPFGLAEHACEILQQCNSDDIILLKLIKKFQMNDFKEEYEEKFSKAEAEKNSRGWQDRNVIYGEDTTIFWNDFIKGLNISSSKFDLGALLNLKFKARDENGQFYGDEVDYLAHLGKSIVKLQNLSVLQCDYITTPGTISLGNVERFHITLFGKKLLEYIELDDKKSEDYQTKSD